MLDISLTAAYYFLNSVKIYYLNILKIYWFFSTSLSVDINSELIFKLPNSGNTTKIDSCA